MRARTVLAVSTRPSRELVASVDASVDPLHFIGRAASRRARGPARVAYFSGRTRELEDLTDFLDAERAGGVRLVTGSPGCGKSAPPASSSCAAHPRLREATRDVWNAAATAPSRLDDIAAVHARQRSTTEIASALARQLVIDGQPPRRRRMSSHCWTDRRTAVTVVIDAVDEAADPGGVVRDLPAFPRRAGPKREGFRVVVGTRTGAQWPMIDPLRRVLRAGELLDLDDVPAPVLAADLRRFCVNVLADDPRFTRKAPGSPATLLRRWHRKTTGRSPVAPSSSRASSQPPPAVRHPTRTGPPRRSGRDHRRRDVGASIPRTLP